MVYVSRTARYITLAVETPAALDVGNTGCTTAILPRSLPRFRSAVSLSRSRFCWRT